MGTACRNFEKLVYTRTGFSNRQRHGGTGFPELGAIIPLQFPTGTGHWGVVIGSTFVKPVDPAVLFLNVAWFENFSRQVGTVDDINYGNIKLGNTFEYSVGLILSLQERLSMSFSLDQRITGGTTQNGVTLADSALNAITFNIGGTYVIPPCMAVDIVVGNRPEQQRPGCQLASPAAEFGQV